ncbi:flagellin [Devosia albogilva]|uniref:Flagellin n=1 Tax=Devosia albogilva TaxID=429726 RepID=A0ABW5QGE9_9HYPH
MADINLSKAVRSNLTSLQNTATLMAKTSDRLSTGNKVNSALDNPTNFFTASSLNSRAGDLNQLMDSMNNGIKTIEAADNGLSAITKNLESMQSTLRQARQDKSFQSQSFALDLPKSPAGTESLSITGGQFGDVAANLSLVKEEFRATSAPVAAYDPAGDKTVTINGKAINIAATTTLDDAIKAINDANAGVTATKGNAGAGTNNAIVLTSNSTEGSVLVENASASLGLGSTVQKGKATVTATAAYVPATAAPMSINGVKVEIAANDTLDQAIDKINASGAGVLAEKADVASGTQNGIKLTALDTNSSIKVAAAANGITTVTQVNPTGAAVTKVSKSVDDLVNEISNSAAFAGKVRATNDNGKLRIENLSTSDLTVKGVGSNGALDGRSGATRSIAGNSVRTDFATQYNELRDQLDKLSDDASFNGINLLRGDNLKLTFNENGTSSIEIQAKGGKAINAGNLKIETSLDAVDLDTDEGIDALLDQVKDALNTVRAQASAFGSNLSIVQNRQDFTKSMINTLETGAGNLTLADMNQEAANMMALQTRQSLASSTLSMANQADQSVLQLLR